MPNLAEFLDISEDWSNRTVTLSGRSVAVLFSALAALHQDWQWRGESVALSQSERDTIDAIISLAGDELLTPSVPTGGNVDYIHLRDEKAKNTQGGDFISGAWRKRDVTVEAADTGNYASLSSSQIGLAAGTYRALISCPGFYCNAHQARLQNVTDATTLLLGTSEFSPATGTSMSPTRSLIAGRFTLTDSKTLEVQHRCSVSRSVNGFGPACNLDVEVYTIVELWREQ